MAYEPRSDIQLLTSHPELKDMIRIATTPSWNDPYMNDVRVDTITPIENFTHEQKAIMYYFATKMEHSVRKSEKEISKQLFELTKYHAPTLDDVSNIIDKI